MEEAHCPSADIELDLGRGAKLVAFHGSPFVLHCAIPAFIPVPQNIELKVAFLRGSLYQEQG